MAHAPALAAATSGVNRHLRGETNEIMLKKKGTIPVNTGDLMFVDAVNGASAGGGTASFLAFPAAYCSFNTHAYFEVNFAGVAMSGSLSGVTEEIPVATTGIFRYPVSTTTGMTCSPGYIVSGASYGAGGASIFSQKVVVGSAAGTMDEGRIGYCVRAEGAATTVDFNLVTRFSGGTKGLWMAS